MTKTNNSPARAEYTQVELLRGPAGACGTELHLEDDGSTLRRSILPGGVRVITEQVPGLRSGSLGLWTGVGSRDELAGQEGSTHFLEHLLFKGTSKRGAREIAEAFDLIGGETNAATAKEHTSYYARVQGQDIPQALEVVTDMVTSSLLAPGEVDTERGVILSELAEAADDPADVAHEAFASAIFGANTPLGRPIGGTAETVTAVSRDAVWEHYRRNYASDTLVVAAAGAVDHEEICQRVLTHLAAGGWDTSSDAAPRPRRFENAQAVKMAIEDTTVVRESEQTHLYIGIPGIPARDDRRWAMSVFTTILGGGMSSRLFQEVREKRGMAYTTYAFDHSYADGGAFGLYAGCAAQNVEEVAKLLVGELERIAADGVTEPEMQRARGQIRGSLVLGGEDSLARMGRLGRAEVSTGRLRSMQENLRLLDAVTASDVQLVAAQIAKRNRCRVVVGPQVQ